MNTTRRIINVLITILITISFSGNIIAQNGERREKLETAKVDFFTRELALTKTEADSFWPVFNDYSNRKDKINRDRKVLYEYVSSNKDYMSDAEVQESLAKQITYQKQETELLETFNKKFLEILPPKKVMMIYVTENQFKVFILKQIRDNRQAAGKGF
jgi:hypothetical protein